MSQRNPMNDRYQTDEHRGQTRKSAATMKPKTKAASSVRVQPTQKTKQQKKAEQKAARAKQTDLDRQYYNPPTPEYKRLRKIWWGLIIGAIAMMLISFFGRAFLPEVVIYVAIGLAYIGVIGALFVDFSKIRKVRRAYQEEMASKKTKEMRAAEKKQKAAQRAVKQEASEKYEDAKAAEAEKPKKRGLFGNGFRLSNAEESKKAKQEAKAQKASDKTQDESSAATNSVIERARADAKAAEKSASQKNDSNK